jgi:hypothetical protein
MNLKISRVFITLLFIFIFSCPSSGYELKTRYVTITYNNEDNLRRFNKGIYLGSLSYLLWNRKSITAEDDIKNKLDAIVERVESVLEMYPKEVKFTIALLPSEDAVHGVYKTRYGKSSDYISFYSSKDKIIFVSVKDIDLGILAHEIAHAIIDSYYGISTPSRIHEILAEYVEAHLKD